METYLPKMELHIGESYLKYRKKRESSILIRKNCCKSKHFE